MRLLIHGLNFAPELTGIGKYTGEMAAYLENHGYEVRVITTPPYYPHWKVQPGYSGRSYRRETDQGVRILRCPLWVPRQPTGIKRILHLLSFAFSSFPAMLSQLSWRPHLVMSIAPAFACAPFSLLTARLARSRAWLHIQDFEVEAALNLGILKGVDSLGRFLLAGEAALLKRFDRVTTISQAMLQHLTGKGVTPEKTGLLINWVDDVTIHPTEECNPFRQEWELDARYTVALFSGNMGEKQGLEIVIAAAKALEGDSHLQFILCGEGAARPRLERQAAGLKNLRFLPLQPVEKLNALLNAADIHLLPQLAGAANLVMPSKLGGMLASGRAVVATANPGTDLAEVVGKVGMVAPPGNADRLVEAILTLYKNSTLRSELGRRGRNFIESNWSKELVLQDFLAQIEILCKEKP